MVNAVQAAAQDNSRGVLKRQIEAGNLQAILGIVNKNMYSFPEASAIRETTTNAVDSVLEKQQAIAILTGKLKIEDVYIQRESEDPQYQHSQFDKDYYNLAHLSSDNNVYVTYIEGDGIGHDTIEIKDFGVGLSDIAGLSGKPRIIGIHNSSFSTKRNSYGTFGAFGLGAKSPLAMANSYIIKTVYNGRKYELDCGEHYTKSLIGPFSDGKANKLFEWQTEGVKWYYKETDEPNGVTVSIPCKVVQRQEVINAIKQQLLFMSNVKYYYKPYNQAASEVDFHGKKAYESRNIVISETPTYNVPHIIIVKDPDKDTHDNAVCYGVINWAKLDMPLLKGCVGIKVPIRVVTHDEEGNQIVLREGVEVNPSRETVIWNDVTAKYIKYKLEEVSKEVTKILEEKLKTDNILEFIRLRTSFVTGDNNKSQYLAVAELAKLVNPTQWDLNFKGLKISELSYLSVSLQKNKNKISYISKQFNTSIGYSTEFGNCPVYLIPKDVEIDNKVVRYLITTHNKSVHFVYIDFFNFKADLPLSQQVSFQIIPVNYAKFVEYVKQSGEAKMYSADLMPADYVEEVEEEKQVVVKPVSLSPEELRKQNEEVLIYTPKYSFSHWISEGVYTFAKTTIKRKDLVSYGQDELTKGSICYYGTEEDRELLCMTVSLLQPLHKGYRNYAGLETLTDVLVNLNANNSLVYSTKENSYRFILVSQQVKNIIKKLPNYKHISLFSQDITIKDNNLKMELAQEIIAYNTAKYLHDKLPQLKFLTNYENIDADKAEKYKKLRAYCEDHYLLTPFHSYYSKAYVRPLDALHTSLNKINEAQLALRSMTEDPESSEQILAYVKTILGLHDSIKSLQITGLDLYYVDLAQELLDYSLTIKDMLNYVSVLTEENKNIEQSTLDLIKLFIKTIKG